MSKAIGWLFTLAFFCCVIGCEERGGNVVEDAEQSEIEAYEQMIAEEEAQMNQAMEGSE